MAATPGLRQTTLSHQLVELAHAGLVRVERQGLSLFHSVNLDATEELIGSLAFDVGRGRPDVLPSFHPMREVGDQLTARGYKVLFICSGNSARSIFAEALLRDLGTGKFNVYSAGTRPDTTPNPNAFELLKRYGHDVSTLRSKHVPEFHGPGAPRMDFVFTVCDIAAAEECPPRPGSRSPLIGACWTR